MLFGSELGYNYEVPVSRHAVARCFDADADCWTQVCDHCHNLLVK
jgi:hypothetical protein